MVELAAYGLDEAPSHRLRYGLIVDSEKLQRWQIEVLEWLEATGVADLALVVVGSPGGASGGGRPTLAGGLLRVLGLHPRRSEPADVSAHVEGVPQLAGAHVDRVREAELDFVLHLGSALVEGEILEAPEYGVWAFHYGESAPRRLLRADLAALATGEPMLAISLRRLTNGPHAGVMLKSGRFRVDAWSPSVTLDRALHGSTVFPTLVCRDILNGAGAYVEALQGADRSIGEPSRDTTLRLLGRIPNAGIRRIWRRAFGRNDWSVGVATVPHPGAPFSLAAVRWIAPTGARGFLADPFLVPGTDGRVLLCERFDYGKGRGVIERVEGDGRPTGSSAVIDDPRHHLSYPFLYYDRGRLYCVPERAASGHLVAFHLSDDATKVLGESVLMQGVQAVDPTLVRYDDRWWLFCTLASEGLQSHLFVFHAPAPEGPWQAHLQNPVVVDAGSARPAGKPFLLDGHLVRPGQDGSLRYGAGVGLHRIDVMTPNSYQETRIGYIAPVAGTPAADGLHHISFDDQWVAVDGYVARESVTVLIDKVRSRLARRRSATGAPPIT